MSQCFISEKSQLSQCDISAREVDYCSAPYDLKEAAAKIAELERVQYVLRTQLGRAAEDVMRMANERDLLMEISNSLHADFNRLESHRTFGLLNLSCLAPQRLLPRQSLLDAYYELHWHSLVSRYD